MIGALWRRGPRGYSAGLALALFLVLGALEAGARQNIRQAFFAVYPGALGTPLDTVPSHPTHCGVCHFDFGGGGPRNPYGVQIEAALPSYPDSPEGRQQAINSVENNDADGDGFSTLIEVTDTVSFVNTPTFPGLTPANVQSVSDVTITDITPYLVPETGADVTPPSVTLQVPNGGGIVVGNAAATVLWTASDASGIAAVHIHLSDDNGVSFRVLAEGLGNTGSHQIYYPNRPTTQAILRVIAVDNAGNTGYDDSNSTFTVMAPPFGVVPTTLRDFDHPGSQPFEGGTLSSPANCAACHGNYAPAVEPHYNWQGSMMSQASRDLLFEACLAVANHEVPDSGDMCLRCHVGQGWLRGRCLPTDGTQVIEGDKTGVSCDLCHRVVDPFYAPGISPPEDEIILAGLVDPPAEFGNGMYVVDPTGARRGPFTDADSGHIVLVSPFHREAAFCGTCHDVSNPAFEKDGQGNYVPNTFNQRAGNFSAHTLMPIERTFSEWFYSAYNTPEGVYAPQFGGNKSYVSICQDCHMRDVTGKGCNFVAAPERSDLPLHDLTGGSTWLPGLLPALYPNIPDEVNPAALTAGIERARYMLQNAASLDVQKVDDTLQVTVTNETGHKLPTGYPEGRRIWLNVKFYDAGQTLLAESGAYDPATGVLMQDPAAKIYESKPGLDAVTAPLVGAAPGPSFHFVLNNKIYKDNRIPPRGFTNAAYADFGGSPVAATYADGQHWDVTLYAVPPGAASATVTLYYQSTSKEYVEFLRDENSTNNKGQQLYNLWANYGRCPPEPMASVTLSLSVPVLPGDLNCNGSVGFDDINPFVLRLSNPAGYLAAYPDCPDANGDINGSGAVGFDDINPFVELLSS